MKRFKFYEEHVEQMRAFASMRKALNRINNTMSNQFNSFPIEYAMVIERMAELMSEINSTEDYLDSVFPVDLDTRDAYFEKQDLKEAERERKKAEAKRIAREAIDSTTSLEELAKSF